MAEAATVERKPRTRTRVVREGEEKKKKKSKRGGKKEDEDEELEVENKRGNIGRRLRSRCMIDLVDSPIRSGRKKAVDDEDEDSGSVFTPN